MTFTDAPPNGSAPRAGGSIVNPHPPKIKDDPVSAGGGGFEIRTSIEKRSSKKPLVATSPTHSSSSSSNDTTTTTTDNTITPILHSGGCHCGQIRFQCLAPPTLTVWDCNCSDCRLRRNVHFIVSKNDLTIIFENCNENDEPSPLAEYRWGTGMARHLFCARCGITPFYVPRSNPDGYAVTFACLDEGTVEDVIVRHFDGRHWEEFIDGEGGDIKSFSVSKEG